MSPVCATPFLAGCRVYTNLDGYHIAGGMDSTGVNWNIGRSGGSGTTVQLTVYRTDTLMAVNRNTGSKFRIPVSISDYPDAIQYCSSKKGGNNDKVSSDDGLCGTTCTLQACAGQDCNTGDPATGTQDGTVRRPPSRRCAVLPCPPIRDW